MFRNLLIIVAVFGIGWGASFGAGMAAGRRSVPAAPAAQAAGIPFGAGAGQAGAGGAGGQGGAGAQGGALAGGAMRAGVVERVEGQTLTLRGPNNQPVRVTLTDQTQVLKTTEGTTGDLAAGATVMIQPQGQPGADGSVSAATITVLPANAAGRAGQGGPGPGAQRPGGQQGQGGQGQQGQRAGG